MNMYDEWNGLADFLAGVIEKYACEMELDSLPDLDGTIRQKGYLNSINILWSCAARRGIR